MASLAMGARRPAPTTINDITDTNYLVNNFLTSSNLGTVSLSTQTPNTPPTKRQRHAPQPYSPGELGKCAIRQSQELARLGWDKFFKKHQTPTSIHPNILRIPHPTAQYLHNLACNGVHTVFPSDWTRAQCDAAYKRGPHPSAATHYRDFLITDMYEYVQMGYWVVLPY
jgi:hypothetical protein